MIVIAPTLSLTLPEQFTLNHPVIGYHSLVTASGISATSEDPISPVDNLATPSSHLFWKSLSFANQFVTAEFEETDPIDYMGVANHNFGSAAIPVSVEGAFTETMGVLNWTELVPPVLLGDDSPAIFRFNPVSLLALRLRMQPSLASPQQYPFAAVMYVGKLLTLQRKLYVGHTPITMSKVAKITNARSEDGHFLGRIVLNEQTDTSVALQNLTPDWVRLHLSPFILASKRIPFFFAWRPQSYPREVGYAWMMNDPRPTNQLPNGMMSVDFSMSGII